MQPLFLADADLRYPIIRGLNRIDPSIDFQTALQAKLAGLPDREVLRVAAESGRIVVSHDRRTMAAAFYEFIRHQASPGLVLVKQGCPVRQAIDQLRLCYYTLNTEEFANRIQYIPF
ncbi:MAG TPA: DUF5615 family PIN-like protein [Bryobacteraceae bacterium]